MACLLLVNFKLIYSVGQKITDTWQFEHTCENQYDDRTSFSVCGFVFYKERGTYIFVYLADIFIGDEVIFNAVMDIEELNAPQRRSVLRQVLIIKVRIWNHLTKVVN